MNMNTFSELKWRRLAQQWTLGIDKLLQTPQVVYLGIDATGDSLHVGHLLALTTLRRFQRAGHKPIVVIGGATGMIGPSKDRNPLTLDTVCKNAICIGKQVKKFLGDIEVTNNFKWMKDFKFIDFVRDVGKHFSEDSELNYRAFSYMLVQAYDFVYLHNEAGCTVQIGRNDQWGNILSGIHLARSIDGSQLYGLAYPQWTQNTTWLDPKKTSPNDFFQYWLNIKDEDVKQCLCLFTDLDMHQINALMARHGSDPGKRIAQERLAAELTSLVHNKVEFVMPESPFPKLEKKGGPFDPESMKTY